MPGEMIQGSYDHVLGLLPPEARAGVDSWRHGTSEGNDQVIRSFAHEDWDYDTVADKYRDLSTGYDSAFDEVEQEEHGNVGPFSVRWRWEDRKFSLNAFYSNRSFVPQAQAYQQAFRDVKSLVKPGSLTPLTLDQSVARLPKNKLSGLPWFTSDPEAIPNYVARAKLVLSGAAAEKFLWPPVAGWRGQPGGRRKQDNKQRLVWMYDKVDVILGLRYLHPILDALRAKPMFAAWNDLSTVDRVITSMIKEAQRRAVPLYSTDFSGFDSSLPGQLIDDAIAIVASWFREEEREIINFLGRNLKTLGILTPEGVSAVRDGGMPSGTVFTNLVDSIVNLICSRYTAIKLGVKHVGVTVLGDDAINVYDPDPGIEAISEAAADLNLTQNPDKQHVSEKSVHYLQRVHTSDYSVQGVFKGVRSIVRTANGVVNYERGRKGVGLPFAVSRNIMQWENAANGPAFQPALKLYATENRVCLLYTSPSPRDS